jgi:CRP-like cAMP-binding protein
MKANHFQTNHTLFHTRPQQNLTTQAELVPESGKLLVTTSRNVSEKPNTEARFKLHKIFDVFESFRNFLVGSSITPLSDSQFQRIITTMRARTFRKRHYFLQEGEICRYFGFIVKGAMRQYSVDDNGIEHMVRLSLENSWVGDQESWVMRSPSIYNIDAWEETQMLLLTKEESLQLAQTIPAYDEMLRSEEQKSAIATQKRVHAAISLPAHKRYADFMQNYPDVSQRFPQHIIASYLGITKETLSRVRKQLFK